MAVKISDLAKKLEMSEKELRAKSKILGVDIDAEETEIDEEIAELLEMELSGTEKDTADVYDEMIANQMDREIVKTQRKKTAGSSKKEVKKDKVASSSDLKNKIIEIEETISVKELAEKAELSPAKIIGELMKNGILANINQLLDYETASIISDDLGLKLKRKRASASIEDIFQGNLESLL